MRRAAPTPDNQFNNLVRQHGAQLRLIGFVGDDRVAKFALAGTRLRRQDVAGRGVMANHFAGSRFLEAFGRTLMGLHLGHILSWEFVRMAMNRRAELLPECNTPGGLKNPLLLGEAANRADVGHHEGEQILIVVANDVVDPADLQAKAATIGVVADLIKAKRQAIQPDIVEDVGGGIESPAEAVPIAAANHDLVGGRQQGWIGVNVGVPHAEKVFRVAEVGVDTVIEELFMEGIPIGAVVDAKKRIGIDRQRRNDGRVGTWTVKKSVRRQLFLSEIDIELARDDRTTESRVEVARLADAPSDDLANLAVLVLLVNTIR